LFALIYNSDLPSGTKHGKFTGTSKSVILVDERSELISHLASSRKFIFLDKEEGKSEYFQQEKAIRH